LDKYAFLLSMSNFVNSMLIWDNVCYIWSPQNKQLYNSDQFSLLVLKDVIELVSGACELTVIRAMADMWGMLKLAHKQLKSCEQS